MFSTLKKLVIQTVFKMRIFLHNYKNLVDFFKMQLIRYFNQYLFY